MKTKTQDLQDQIQALAGQFYVLGVQYFEGIKGKDIPKWEEDLQASMDEYEDIRDQWVS